MTPAQIKKTRLYRTLAPCVRKQDRKELARMLAMVDWDKAKFGRWGGTRAVRLSSAFDWDESPQGFGYWNDLSVSLAVAGHRYW